MFIRVYSTMGICSCIGTIFLQMFCTWWLPKCIVPPTAYWDLQASSISTIYNINEQRYSHLLLDLLRPYPFL